jgi:hypothetical protein
VSLITDLKVLANRRDVPYQSLLKVFLAERLAQERLREPRKRSVSRGSKDFPGFPEKRQR